MKSVFTFFLFIFFSFFSFSQVITFECNNNIMTVSYEEIANNPNADIDWNGDGLINESDYIMYLQQAYDCDNLNTAWDYNDINWVDTGDFGDDMDWNDFDWEIVWSNYNLGNIIDWGNIPWDNIVNQEILPSDLLDYVVLILGQPFTWSNFIASQSCVDDDQTISTGLSIWTEVSGCEEALSYINTLGYDCFTELNLPFVSANPIALSEVCCETCENFSSNDDVAGCTDENACNYNSYATQDDGNCEYGGVACFVAPCSVSDNPGVDGAYCIDNYCNGCCAQWYSEDNVLISSDCNDNCVDDNAALEEVGALNCEEIITLSSIVVDNVCVLNLSELSTPLVLSDYPDDATLADVCECSCEDFESENNSILGFWYDAANNQYIEITENTITLYSYLDDEFFMCWFMQPAMEYNDLGNGDLEIIDSEGDIEDVTAMLSKNGELMLTFFNEYYPGESENIVLSPVNEFPEIDLCNNLPTNEGCDDIQGQWVYYWPGTSLEVAWMEIDENGVNMFFTEGELECVTKTSFSYGSLEGDDQCTLFMDFDGFQFEFAQVLLNDDGTLSITTEDNPDFPDLWNPGSFDSSSFEVCTYGCINQDACNYDSFADLDNGTCGLLDDCGDCQIPYCYNEIDDTIEYTSEDKCDFTWVGNDCENNPNCLSSSINSDWNSGCVSIEENHLDNDVYTITNMMGQKVQLLNHDGIRFYFYNNGVVRKKYIIR